MKTMKQLQAALNEVNNTNDITVAKESGYYIIKRGGYEIIYNNEVIDTAKDTYEACKLVKEYRIAFKSGNIWYRRGNK